MKISKNSIFLYLIIQFIFLSGCAVNPVTGRNEFSIISEQQELSIGAEQYVPSQQSQGGLYTVDEELSVYVDRVGQRLAAVSDRDLPYEFVVLNNSVPNAWALPGGKIALNRGLLLELNSEAELAAVLGHEIVHAAARHGALAMTRGALLQGAIMVGALASRDNDYSDYIVGASQLGAQLITQSYGRDAERDSDYYGIHYMVRAGYDPRAAIDLQETFVRLSEGNDPGFLQGMFASHPPSRERVENNRSLVAELLPTLVASDLEMGVERYQQALATIQETQGAYALFDDAEQAIVDDDMEIALENVESAISEVPNEARFTGLKADILLNQRRYREAISNYNDAIIIDDQYYDYYLGRGVAYARQGNSTLAKVDLEKSTSLLPTAIAMNELGKLSINANDRAAAKQYFQSAASANAGIGLEARQAFIQLDIEDNPGRYVRVEVFANQDGQILARVSNLSDFIINDITIDFSAVLGSRLGRQQQNIRSLNAGRYVDLNSGLAFPEGTLWSQDQMEAVILSAKLQ